MTDYDYLDKKEGYMKRQLYFMSNLGLFWIIIVGLFAVPLMGTFVVILIKGALDFKYVIISVGSLLTGLALFYGIRLFIRIYRRFKQGNSELGQELKDKIGRGDMMQVSMFGGLINFTYGGTRQADALAYHQENDNNILLLPQTTETKNQTEVNIVEQIKELCELKNQGVIDEEEFQILKKKLIRTGQQ
ncbi:SHOCT domain-containing protein [Candidatus Magnetomoraceae bacterium gMMP-15]